MRAAFSSIFKRVTAGTVLALLMAATASLSGCTPDSKSESLGPLPTASFTVAPLAGKVNTWVATASTNGIFQWEWDPGLGTGSALGPSADTVFLRFRRGLPVNADGIRTWRLRHGLSTD
jgi:hypothetical protein